MKFQKADLVKHFDYRNCHCNTLAQGELNEKINLVSKSLFKLNNCLSYIV